MSIRSSKSLKDDLNLYKDKISTVIYKLLMKEFNIYLERTRLGIDMPNYKTLLTEAFCDFYLLSYILDFSKKSLTEKNFSVINEYLYEANKKIKTNKIKNVVIITAEKNENNNENFNEFVSMINYKFKVGVKVRHTNWYHTDFFKDNILHYDQMFILQENLHKHFNKFDKNLFAEIANPELPLLKLDYKALWNDYFSRIILNSFARFDIMPTNYVKGQTENLQRKILNSLDPSTLIIYYNNVDVKKNYKTAFLNDIKIFKDVLENDIPVITVGDYDDLSLVKVITQKNFKTLNEVTRIFNGDKTNIIDEIEEPELLINSRSLNSNKRPVPNKVTPKTTFKIKNKDDEKITNNKSVETKEEKTNTLNMFWDEEISKTNINRTNNDLIKTIDFDEPEVLDEILKTTEEHNVSTKTVQMHSEPDHSNEQNSWFDFKKELLANESEVFNKQAKPVTTSNYNVDADEHYSATIDFNKGFDEEEKNINTEDFEFAADVELANANDYDNESNHDFESFAEESLSDKALQEKKLDELFQEIRNTESKTQTNIFTDDSTSSTVTKTINLGKLDEDDYDEKKYSDILLTVLNNDDTSKVEDYIFKLYDYKETFKKFCSVFVSRSKNLKFSSQQVNNDNINKIKAKISSYDFKDLSEYIEEEFETFNQNINSGSVTKENFIIYYLIYLKANLSINKIEYIELVH